METQFEWDLDKAASNLQKHKIDFLDAITVFDDPMRIEKDVTKPVHGETRRIAIGTMLDGGMATVVFTIRNQKRRNISARKVRKNERQEYQAGLSADD